MESFFFDADISNWHKLRGQLYSELATWGERPFDQVAFGFSKPKAGWIDCTVYVNEIEKCSFPLSCVFDPFQDFKHWMEDIVKDDKMLSEFVIDAEGRSILFHYEHLELAQVGYRQKDYNLDRKDADWECFDANSEADKGLFFIYDTDDDLKMPVVCYCRTKDFLQSLYNSLMYYASRSISAKRIADEWYIDNYDAEEKHDQWYLYNQIKSPLVEWNQDSAEPYRLEHPNFAATPPIRETIHMWAEYGDALFWHQDGCCCGNAESLFLESSDVEIKLSNIPQLRSWYDEFDKQDPLDNWPDDEYNSWFARGFQLAKRVRRRLPADVDLFFGWKCYKSDDAKCEKIEVGILVPDGRILLKSERPGKSKECNLRKKKYKLRGLKKYHKHRQCKRYIPRRG